MTVRRAVLLICLLLGATLTARAQLTISGTVYEAGSEEAMIGATIIWMNSEQGTISNAFGFFSLTVPDSVGVLRVSFIGFEPAELPVTAGTTMPLQLYMHPAETALESITVTAGREDWDEAVRSVRMGTVSLTPAEVSRLPVIAGETDLIKAAQLLPGVTPGNEGSIGMFVRGGTDDQNLVILDDAVVYNLGHLFGFFSVFNTDAIRDVELMKGGFGSRYGGRLSSVMDVRMKEGSMETIQARGGIGLLTSRLTVDGPLIPNRMSFMVAGRRTYIDRVFGVWGASLPYYFYDINAKINYRISTRDRIFFSSYLGDDILRLEESNTDEDGDEALGFGFSLGNVTTTLRWNHIYPGNRLFSNITLHQTRFKYDIRGNFVDNAVLIRSEIQDVGIKGDWEWYASPGTTLRYGFNAVTHFFRPNVISTSGNISEFIASSKPLLIRSTEPALYGEWFGQVHERFSITAGVRIAAAVTGSRVYLGPEPRITLNWRASDTWTFRSNYNLMRQYMHRVSSSSVALPTDLWYPVTERVKPQGAHQAGIGFIKGFPSVNSYLDVEVYVKSMNGLIEYREGANLILNDNFERELIRGTGTAFGAEFLLRRRMGAVSGWLAYSWTKTTRQFPDLNSGDRFPARFDRRHQFNSVLMLKLSPRVQFSAVWLYMSGARFTAQTRQFFMPNASLTGIDMIPVYSRRNAVALSPTHRLDINFTVSSAQRRRYESEWQIGAYNFYSRTTPYRIVIRNNGSAYQYEQTGLFGFIPSVSYHFTFKQK